MRKIKVTVLAVICVMAIIGIAVAATTTDSGQHLGSSYDEYVYGPNAAVNAYGTSSSARSYARNSCGSQRNVNSIVYSYNTSNTLLDSSSNSATTSSSTWIDSGSVTREATNYYRYYKHKCTMYIPTGNILTDTVQYTARQDQGY